MKFLIILLPTCVYGCNDSQPRTRTQLVKNSGQSGAANAEGAAKTGQDDTNGGVSGKSGASANADNNPNGTESPAANGSSPTADQGNGQPTNSGGAGQVEKNNVLAETNLSANITNPPPTEPQPTQGASNSSTAPTLMRCGSVNAMETWVRVGSMEPLTSPMG